MKRRPWSLGEDALLRQSAAGGADLGMVAAALGRTREAVYQRAFRIGARSRPPSEAPRSWRPWTAAEDAVLAGRGAETYSELAAALGRSPAAVEARARSLGIRRHRPGPYPPRLWTAREDAVLQELFARYRRVPRPLKEAAGRRLGRSLHAVHRRWQVLRHGAARAAA